jgi:hypothetical protein
MNEKIAIITGGSRGLSRNTAVNLARREVGSWDFRFRTECVARCPFKRTNPDL